jgi:hypothetical protein
MDLVRQPVDVRVLPTANRVLQLAVATMLVLLVCLPASPQTQQGRIEGTVVDQSGGVIVDAAVTVTDVDRGVARSLITDSAGAYAASSLLPGKYTVRAEAKGFKTAEHSDIVVQVGQNIRIDVTLQPGEANQTITVSGAPPLVDTTSATLGGTLSNQTINDLPLNGRNYVNLLPLRPGVIIYPGGGGTDQSTDGLRVESNVYLVDGLLNANPDNGQSVINSAYKAGDSTSILPVDSIQEFTIQVNPKAEYGWKAGAHVNLGLKSGTNTIHGTAYAYGRDGAWDARNYFNQAKNTDGASNPETPVELEQFGASAGGRIITDKLFWFGAYEGQLYSVGNILVGSAPAVVSVGNPAASLVDACNDLNTMGTAINPLSAQLAGLNTSTCVVSPPTSTFESLFPMNKGTNPGGPTVYSAPLISSNSANSGVAKVDYILNPRNSFNGSYFIGTLNGTWVLSADELAPQWQTRLNDKIQAGGGAWTWTPNSTWVNELRAGYDYATTDSIPVDSKLDPASPWPTGYGINTGVTKPLYFGMPYIQITSLNNFALGSPNQARAFHGPDGEFEIVDNVSYLHGRHTSKFGVDFLYQVHDENSFRLGAGRIRFRSIEDFLTGTVKDGELLVADPTRDSRGPAIAGFFQDDWRVKPNLTLNLGVRYEYSAPPTTRNHLAGNFDPTLGLVQAGVQIPTQVNSDFADWSPRFGLAWNVRGNGKTVVRVGAGIVYDTTPFGKFIDDVPFGADIVTTNPVTGAVTTTLGSQLGALQNSYSGSQLNWSTAGPIFPIGAVGNRFACGDGVGNDPSPCGTFAVDRNIRTPYVANWSLSIQQAFTNNLTLQVAYVGNHGARLIGYTDLNQPPIGAGWFGPSNAAGTCLASASDPVPYDNCSPSGADEAAAQPFAAKFPYLQYINWVSNHDRSNYNGLQLTLTQRAYHGLFFLAGYTYSHGLDDLSYFSNPTTQIAGQPIYGSSDYDVRHRFTFSATYAIPGKKSPAQMLEGWQINSIVTLQSGLPWGVQDASNDFNGTGEVHNPPQEGWSTWDFYGSPGAFTSGPHPIPFYAPGPLSSFPAVCQQHAQANGQLAVASLVNNGCYVQGNGVLVPPPFGSIGNTGRNLFRDSGFRNWDMSVVKGWKFNERFNVQFRAEFFNVLNHPKFANPYGARSTYLNNDPSGGFGFGCGCVTPDAASGNFVLGTGGARDIQLGLKLIF